jgi:hypothetical protein
MIQTVKFIKKTQSQVLTSEGASVNGFVSLEHWWATSNNRNWNLQSCCIYMLFVTDDQLVGLVQMILRAKTPSGALHRC